MNRWLDSLLTLTLIIALMTACNRQTTPADTPELEIQSPSGCGETPFGFKALEDIPQEYSVKDAISDGCVIYPYDQDTFTLVTEFLDKVYMRMPAMLRVASVTTEGDIIFTDVEYKQAECGSMAFFYTYDSTRDKFGPGEIKEGIYSFLNCYELLNDIGKNVVCFSLCNYNFGDEIDMSSQHVFLRMIRDEFNDPNGIAQKIKQQHMETDVTQQTFSTDGKYCVSRTSQLLTLLVAGGRSGTISVSEDMAEKITHIIWISDHQVQLVGNKDDMWYQKIAVFNLESWEFE